ncbi:MAG TPA: glycosyltransferase family 1 protein, partial [Spirochaetia bacterium]|nr:glycosyltransferase family 1 protein [Spirochaetia bacterium]
YDRGIPPLASPVEVADRIEKAVRSRWPSGCDLYHIHNPLLKKNSIFLDVIKILIDRGKRVLLHVHDFAEDGRPASYYRNTEYPADCHYAVINSSDYEALKASGLTQAGLHLIPNCVRPLPIAQVAGERNTILYPVRGIGRKNIGECLLLSLFLPDGCSLGITLPPHSQRDRAVYENFKAAALDLALRVQFDVGIHTPFEKLLAGTRLFITTSVKEGFGFSFLEPWTIGAPVVGRRIDSVVGDFESNGVDLSHLYRSLYVPEGAIDRFEFASRFRDSYNRMRTSFGLAPLDLKDADVVPGSSQGGIDFSLLDEVFQISLIRKTAQDKRLKYSFIEANPWLLDLFDSERYSDTLIEKNREAVLRVYGRESMSKILLSTYESVLSVPVKQSIDKKVLLHQFLSPERFRMVVM